MLNVMEERDIQVRGYTLRLPLDVLVVASANPEDYTNRGRIITPLKDRFGAEIRTHYPLELDAEVGVIKQEAHLARRGAGLPAADHRPVRPLPAGVAARSTSAPGCRRGSRSPRRKPLPPRPGTAAAILGEQEPVARVVDLGTVIDVLRGKLEFDSGEEGREQAVLEHLLRRATADTAPRATAAASTSAPLVAAVEDGSPVDHRGAGVGQGRAGRAARPARRRRDRHNGWAQPTSERSSAPRPWNWR